MADRNTAPAVDSSSLTATWYSPTTPVSRLLKFKWQRFIR